MSIELQPLGVKCSIACDYCYQTEQRKQEGPQSYSLEKMQAALIAEGVGGNTGFSFFGGEPLLMPLGDFETMLEWAKARGVRPSVQTSATTVTEKHFELFERFGVSVGVSLDGPGELNGARSAKDPAKTAQTSALAETILKRLLTEKKISTSLIVTLHQVNAGTEEKLATLIAWVKGLVEIGLKWVNFHPLEVDTEQAKSLVMPEVRQIEVMRALRRELAHLLHCSPFTDMQHQLLGVGQANCVWHGCDPYTTPAVRGINGQGEKQNCGRTNKDGVAYVKATTSGQQRQLALYLTPQEHGGCQGCRFFYACAGECPGTGEGQDWRSRTSHCEMIKAVMGDMEVECVAEGKTPISQSLQRAAIEAQMLAAWERGAVLTVAQAVSKVAFDNVGHAHGDIAHGDQPHGDSHGDHHDQGAK